MPLKAQIKLIEDQLILEKENPDSEQNSVFHATFQNIEAKNFNNLLGSPSENLENIGNFWIKSRVGILISNILAQELFNFKNLRIIQFLRKKLITQGIPDWIIVISTNETLIFSMSHNFIICWSIIPKNLASLLLASIFVNPGILEVYNDKIRLQSYQNGFSVFLKIIEFVRKSDSHKNGDTPKLDRLRGFTSPNEFFMNYSQTLNDFEMIKLQNDTHPTNIDITRFLDLLQKNILIEQVVELSYVDLLDLTLIHLLEYPPLPLNIDKLRGQYFTPLELTFPLVSHSFNKIKTSKISSINNIKKLKILDPASGTGLILIVALEWLVNQVLQHEDRLPFSSLLQLRKELFLSSFFGFDIDEKIINFSGNIINLFLSLSSDLPENSNNLQKKNFLHHMSNNYKNNIPHPRYDLILSNPPYIPLSGRFSQKVIPPDIRKILKQMIPKFMGKRDNLYIMFLGLALSYSSRLNDGVVSFVIDHSFLDLSSYSEIRKTLLEKYTLIYLLENYKYKQAVVDLSILILGNSKDHEKDSISFLGQKNLNYEPKIEPTSHFSDHPNFIFKIYRKMATREILNQINSVVIKLGDISKVSCGLEYGSMLKSHFLSNTLSSDMYRVIDGANGLPQSFVTFWVSGMKNSFVRFSKDYEDYLRENNLNRSKVGNKEVLLISGEKERFTEPKILVRQTASKFIVNYDEKGFFGLRNLHTIYNIQTPYSPYLIVGILTSALGNWLGEELNIIRTSGTEGNRYPQIRIRDMNHFPIISLKNSTNVQVQRIKQLEVKTQENIQIGSKVSNIYEKIWKLVKSNSEVFPFSSQKRLFHFCKNPEKFSVLSKTTRMNLSFLLKELEKYQAFLNHNQRIMDEIVFKIYGITKKQWEKLL